MKIVSRLGGVARNYCFPRPLFLTLADGKYAKIKVLEVKPPILPIKSTASRNLTEKKSKSFLGAKSEGVKGAKEPRFKGAKVRDREGLQYTVNVYRSKGAHLHNLTAAKCAKVYQSAEG